MRPSPSRRKSGRVTKRYAGRIAGSKTGALDTPLCQHDRQGMVQTYYHRRPTACRWPHHNRDQQQEQEDCDRDESTSAVFLPDLQRAGRKDSGPCATIAIHCRGAKDRAMPPGTTTGNTLFSGNHLGSGSRQPTVTGEGARGQTCRTFEITPGPDCLRAYPNNPAARNEIRAQAKCRKAR